MSFVDIHADTQRADNDLGPSTFFMDRNRTGRLLLPFLIYEVFQPLYMNLSEKSRLRITRPLIRLTMLMEQRHGRVPFRDSVESLENEETFLSLSVYIVE